MTLGDVLEIAGLVIATAAAYLGAGLVAALVIIAIALIYEGQCFGSTPLKKSDADKTDAQ